MSASRERPAARVLVTDPLGRVLLFKFEHRGGALDGQVYWATPGGGVEAGETYEMAAIRELREETGIVVDDIGPLVAAREQLFVVDSGETVRDIERYFHVRVSSPAIDSSGWSLYEKGCMTDYRWWSASDLARTSDAVWPRDLPALLAQVMQTTQMVEMTEMTQMTQMNAPAESH